MAIGRKLAKQLKAARLDKANKSSWPKMEQIPNVKPSFLTAAKLESFEEGVFADNKNLVTTSREDAFIKTLFDFNLWESPPQ
ncbi:hypothetical protein PCASD_02184 [Puccinia coronata f. sp. avenae]|uniref:Uncharacterized protein n=1 Tax=Puccinia coronata f. sp. avenae TaxID=200324 RepID=A0A2N5VI33_9BASI|nr:hypothetical protein PCASD_02184 [Puccinia coronata f. sp. avenae]